jgi:hypothetical protein
MGEAARVQEANRKPGIRCGATGHDGHPSAHIAAAASRLIDARALTDRGLTPHGYMPSPLRGGEGQTNRGPALVRL